MDAGTPLSARQKGPRAILGDKSCAGLSLALGIPRGRPQPRAAPAGTKGRSRIHLVATHFSPRTTGALEELDATPEWRSLRARRSGRVLAMDANAYVSRPGPRLVDSAEIIAQWYTTLAEHAG